MRLSGCRGKIRSRGLQGHKPGARRLLAEDVVGYSRLMVLDEEGTLARLRSSVEAVESQITKHGDHVFGGAGDSLIVECSSAIKLRFLSSTSKC